MLVRTCTIAWAALVAAASANAATLSAVNGQILVNPGSGYQAVTGGAELKPGDLVLAGPGGSAKLSFLDGCTAAVEPGSVVAIGQASPCASSSQWQQQEQGNVVNAGGGSSGGAGGAGAAGGAGGAGGGLGGAAGGLGGLGGLSASTLAIGVGAVGGAIGFGVMASKSNSSSSSSNPVSP